MRARQGPRHWGIPLLLFCFCSVEVLSRLLQAYCNPAEPGASSESLAGVAEAAQGTGGFASASPEFVLRRENSPSGDYFGKEEERVSLRLGSRAGFAGQNIYPCYCVEIDL